VNGLKGFQYGATRKSYLCIYDLNFFALGTFSPLSTRSAPMPPLGQPYFGPKILRNKLQDDPVVNTSRQAKMITIWRGLSFIAFPLGRWLLKVF